MEGKKAILFLPDVIGIWKNSKLMADQFAENGGSKSSFKAVAEGWAEGRGKWRAAIRGVWKESEDVDDDDQFFRA